MFDKAHLPLRLAGLVVSFALVTVGFTGVCPALKATNVADAHRCGKTSDQNAPVSDEPASCKIKCAVTSPAALAPTELSAGELFECQIALLPVDTGLLQPDVEIRAALKANTADYLSPPSKRVSVLLI